MSRQSFGKKTSEWVGAPVTSLPCERRKNDGKETFTPSSRELRYLRRTEKIEVQAKDEKYMTAIAIGSRMKSDHEANGISETQKDLKIFRKLSSLSQQDLHHSVDQTKSAQQPLSLDGGLRNESEDSNHCCFIHPKRDSNSTSISRKMETRINFPSSNSKDWEKLNEELEDIIPKVFTDKKINKLSTSEISNQFDAWLHKFFLEKFGPKNSENPRTCTRKARKNKALRQLRQQKKECKAARKALIKAGLKGSQQEKMISEQWFSLIRQHNKLRAALLKKQLVKEEIKAEKSFRENPHKFAARLFHGKEQSGKPLFTADTAQEYFAKIYRDENRNYEYQPLEGLLRPISPQHMFSLRCPTALEVQRSLRRKRNGAAPGFNALTYVPFKRCPALFKFIIKLFRKIWKSKNVPRDWAEAYIILIAKSTDLSSVSEFRPIAITSTMGKIFFLIAADRLQFFMLKNGFISKEVQKGFLAGMPGCLEHSFALVEALRDAKDHYRQIIICWLDLANAYGSVRHNLIQFALHWYHVPEVIQEIIFNYYEQLCAMVTANNWSTGFFLFDIGLFQGCVLSTILFDCVFQLLFDFLQPQQNLGYKFKSAPSVQTFDKAYADDLTLITTNTKDMQIAVNVTDRWLKWSQTMKAKPSKCVSLGFKLFNERIKNETFVPLSDTAFSLFNPG